MAKRAATLAGGWPYFVYGWREAFVPLVVLAHNEHGPTLALAGLAVAATRLGGWLLHKTTLRRPLREASLLCGVALLFLGVAPEEGPISLLLWFLFGLGWPAVQIGLAERTWQGWAGLLALLAGILAAGPLVRGPGTWLVAAGCLLLAWQGDRLVQRFGAAIQTPAAGEPAWTPFWFSAAYLSWAWLLPVFLGDGPWAPQWFVLVMAASWLARGLGVAVFQRFLAGRLAAHDRELPAPGIEIGRRARLTAAWLLAPGVMLALLVQQPWVAAAAFVVCGGLLGVISTQPGIARGELAQLPGARQALGEWIAPLVGAGLVLVGGPTAAMAGAAATAAALAWSLGRRQVR